MYAQFVVQKSLVGFRHFLAGGSRRRIRGSDRTLREAACG